MEGGEHIIFRGANAAMPFMLGTATVSSALQNDMLEQILIDI